METSNYKTLNTSFNFHSFPEIFTGGDEYYDTDYEGTMSEKLFIAKPKILLVEDTIILQTLHMEMLSSIGCNVDLAEDGIQAVKMAKKKFYDLIFMDIGLPRMNGILATKKIREEENDYHRNIIVALTTHSSDIEKECREAGMDDFYKKPILTDKLTDILKYWLPELLIQK